MLSGVRPCLSLRISRCYGTANQHRNKRLDGALSLDHFLQRTKVISLYRTIIRGTNAIADPTTRSESKRYARDEFERHRSVSDLSHIRYLLSTGKTEWESMERYIGGM